MKRIPLRLIAVSAVVLAASGCDFKEKRSGRIALAGAASIPLNDVGGSRAELVAGPAEVTFKKGSGDRSVAIRVRQPGRPEVNIEAPVTGDYRSGNFTLRGSEIGQPVDLVSARAYAVTGARESMTTWVEEGFQRCLVELSWDPCDEDWTVSFRSSGGAELGSFASRAAARCNERQNRISCHRSPDHHEPRVPDFPRGPRGQGIYHDLSSLEAGKVSFD